MPRTPSPARSDASEHGRTSSAQPSLSPSNRSKSDGQRSARRESRKSKASRASQLLPPDEAISDDILGDEEKIMQKKEWLVAELENRLRALVTELMSPTLRKVGEQENELDTLRAASNEHTKKIQNMFQLQSKVVQTNSMLEAFRDDLYKLDTKVHSSCTMCHDDIQSMGIKFEGLQKNLEMKESAINHMQRNLDRCSMELNRVLDAQNETMDKKVQEQIDDMRKTAHGMICGLESKIMGVELQFASLTDQLWGEETGLAKVCGEVKRSREALDEVSDAVRVLQATVMKPEHLSKLAHEVKTCLGKAEDDMKALRNNVGNVVNDTQEHLRTALETVATQHACFMEEVRGKHREELAQAATLRGEVEGFMEKISIDSANIEKRVEQAGMKADNQIRDYKDVIEDCDKKRKRDRTSLELEIKALSKRLGGIFDSHAVVSKGFEHLGSVLGSVLEAVRMQVAYEMQDSADREHMYLLGLREEAAPKEAPAHSPGRAKVPHGSPRRAKKDPKNQIVKVDERCLSCSAQAPTVLSAFKVACLQYNPSPVTFQDADHTRFDILRKIELALQRAHTLYSEGPMAGRAHREEVPHLSPGRARRNSAGNGNNRLNIADFTPLSEGAAFAASKPASQEKELRLSRLPTLHASGPSSVPSTPRDGTRLKPDIIE